MIIDILLVVVVIVLHLPSTPVAFIYVTRSLIFYHSNFHGTPHGQRLQHAET